MPTILSIAEVPHVRVEIKKVESRVIIDKYKNNLLQFQLFNFVMIHAW